ncbi:Suppressor protein SRP40-like [Caenorhabditis elegans]|uniref:Suppressor protein SRP40-like n=1 Tax=Caenorhabditis elegans TaxID=6239 RepID=O01317_CAEEL|nr:Suppressor protein SRP40-like [Caenorhabditis elegans]CAB04050.2 Suppressor protein SRP40-like [Caenorhabditis elegans]|eukprot:NP_492279.2 Uncharacterized protein CELE_F02E9.3 [Caenorhabditis elegans]
MIRRRHSTTRIDRRPDGLTIYYKRANDDMEEEMLRVSVKPEGKNINDSLRSSKSSSSPPSRNSSLNLKTLKKDRKSKEGKPKSSSKHGKRMTSRAIHVSKKWSQFNRREDKTDYLDDETMQILEDLKILNCKIRKRFQIGTTCPHSLAKTDILSSSQSSKSQKSSTTTSSPVLTAVAYDYRGIPLTAPTVFPGARSEKTRETTRKAARAFARMEKEREDANNSSSRSRKTYQSRSPTGSEDSSPVIKLTRVSSGTRFPGASSPGTRERSRLMLKQCAMKKQLDEIARSLKSSKKSRKSMKSKKEKKSKPASLKTIYSKM